MAVRWTVWIGLLLYVRIVMPLFMLRRPYCVADYADHEYFICGSHMMMDAIKQALGE